MANQLLLRCRSTNGQHNLDSLNSNSTIVELKVLIMSLTNIEYENLVMKCGFPPTKITATDESLLTASGIQRGDIIIVEEAKGKSSTLQSSLNAPTMPNKIPAKSAGAPSRTLELNRYVVPANNSCLFASVYFCLRGYEDQSRTPEMRRLVAAKISSDHTKYNEAVLGQTNDDYIRWIMNPDSWGGAIEIEIFSDHYAIEIDVVDIENARIQQFGENKFSKRILLMYDGIHYDPLYLLDNMKQTTMHSTSDDAILDLALSKSKQEQANRNFTNTRKFKLKCLVCQLGLTGQREAAEHAQLTGHMNFNEY